MENMQKSPYSLPPSKKKKLKRKNELEIKYVGPKMSPSF